MALPTKTLREDPNTPPIQDGYRTLITFKSDPDIELWEKGVTPPGVDGGDEVDGTTMHNDTWRVQHPRNLKTFTEVSATVAYAGSCYAAIVALINKADEITVRFGDGNAVFFHGFLKSFTPGEMVEGEQPEADIVIVPTNWDGTVESGAQYGTIGEPA